MLFNQDDIVTKSFELAETEFNTGRYHIIDVVFRRWASLLQEALYAKIGIMYEVSAENVVQMRFEKVLDSVEKQPIYIFETLNHSRGFLLVEKLFFDLILNGTLESSSDGEVALQRHSYASPPSTARTVQLTLPPFFPSSVSISV